MECDDRDFQSRIHKIAGQITAIESMYTEKRNAEEILQQLVAARASLASLAKVVLEAEVKGCLPSENKHDSVSKLVDTLFKVS